MSDAAETASTPVLELDGARATIRLNRPKHLNRLQPDDLDALMKLFDRIEADPAIRVLVLTGTGRAFSAGYDLNSVAERATSTVEQNSAGSAFEVVVNRLEDLGVPTICRLNGGVYGGSTDLALACDFRIGIDSCEMFMPAARLGLHYYKSGIRRYVTRLGVNNAKKLFLTAQKIDAAEMLRIGYLTAMVSRLEELDEEVDKLATILAGNAPVAMRGMKRTINEFARGKLDEASRRPPRPRQHARRRDQGRHQGVRREAPAEILELKPASSASHGSGQCSDPAQAPCSACYRWHKARRGPRHRHECPSQSVCRDRMPADMPALAKRTRRGQGSAPYVSPSHRVPAHGRRSRTPHRRTCVCKAPLRSFDIAALPLSVCRRAAAAARRCAPDNLPRRG